MGAWNLPTGIGTTLGILTGLAVSGRIPSLAAGGAGLAALLLAGRRSPSSWLLIASVGILATAAGALRGTPEPPGLPRLDNARVAGRLLAWEPVPWGIAATLAVHQVNGERRDRPVTARVTAPSGWGSVPGGDWVAFRGDVVPGRGATNPGGWDSREPVIRVRGDGPPRWGPVPAGTLHRARAAVTGFCRSRLGGFPGRLGEAVLLGRSRALLPGERETFRRSGASHLVAVSGLHVGLATMMVALLLTAAPSGVRFAGVTAAAFGYAVLAGCSPSAVRAAAWVGAAALGTGLHRPRPAAAWLALVLPWLVWAEPALVRSVSFQLSLGAVAGILFAMEVVGTPPRGKRLLVPLAVSVGAQWGTLPVIATVFGQIAPAATLPNLLAIPLTGLFLPAIVLAAATMPVAPVSGILLEAARVLALAIKEVLEHSERHLPFWTGLPPALPLVRVLFPALLVLWFSLPRPVRARPRIRAAAFLAAAALAAAVLLPRGAPAGPWCAFLDVGQGDAAVARLSDGTVWVVDVGDDRGPGDAARNALLPFLRHRGIRAVDGLVLSHRHRDHVGALGSFLDAVPVRRIYDAGFGGTRGTPGWVDSVLAAHALWPCLVAAGDTLHAAGPASLVALGPPRADPEHSPGGNLNNASLVVRLDDGPLSILFAGDAETEAETACLDSPALRPARILKVGHHGSDTSTSPAFLRAVSPEWGIVSCGAGNRFRHPRAVTLDRLACRGVRILRTDRDGAVVVSVNGGELEAATHPPVLP